MGNTDLSRLAWDGASREGSLAQLYKEAEEVAYTYLKSYEEKIADVREQATRLRRYAAIIALVGICCPMAALFTDLSRFTSLGFILLFGAAAVYLYDQIMGYSSAWTRYARAEEGLKAAVSQFRLRWAKASYLRSKDGGNRTDDTTEDAIATLQHFMDQVHRTVATEVDTWSIELRSTLLDFDALVKRLRGNRPDEDTSADAPSLSGGDRPLLPPGQATT